jgi:signal transduction histidine kinase
MLEIIEREDRRIARFVDELLDVARIRSGQLHFDFELVDLTEIVRSVSSRFDSELAQSGSTLTVSASGGIVGVWDRMRLEQIVTNLLSNAIKFGMGRPIEITVSASAGVARLVVKDQGLGIPPDRQAAIFQPFERAVSARHYGGLGLGLYIVRTIIEGLGGAVHLQSGAGAGATFTIDLPQARPS